MSNSQAIYDDYIYLVSEMLSLTPKVTFWALGNSMMPFVQNSDLITVNKIGNFADIKIGDIVLIKHSKYSLVLHRVTLKSKTFCITKGDNNLSEDIPAYPNEIIAKLTKIIRKDLLVFDDTQRTFKIMNIIYCYFITALRWIAPRKQIGLNYDLLLSIILIIQKYCCSKYEK